MVLPAVLVLVLVLGGPEDASEDFLIQPGLAAFSDVAQQTDQRAARPPTAPENPDQVLLVGNAGFAGRQRHVAVVVPRETVLGDVVVSVGEESW